MKGDKMAYRKMIASLIGAVLIFIAIPVVKAGDRPVPFDVDPAVIIHVDDDALPGGDGSKKHPFDKIQEGINAAEDGQIILVEDGIYTGRHNRDLNFHGKAIEVRSRNGARDCIINCEGTKLDPHRGFYFSSGEDENSIVNGFTIKNGYMFGPTYEHIRGGAIYCYESSPVIKNNILIRNTVNTHFSRSTRLNPASSEESDMDSAGGERGEYEYWGGGAVFMLHSSAKILNNIISWNRAIGGSSGNCGGGIYCGGPGTITAEIRNNTISINSTDGPGGGIYCNGSAMIADNTVNYNSAEFGGGIHTRIAASRIIGNRVYGNTAHQDGGGIHCWATIITSGYPVITGNLVMDNEAGGDGGGIYHTRRNSVDYPALIMNNFILNNRADYGGGMAFWGSPAGTMVRNCLISDNTAQTAGGALSVAGSDPSITGCTMANNRALLSTASVYCYRNCSGAAIDNTIMWGNSAPDGIQIWIGDESHACSLTMRYSDLEGGQSSVHVEPGSILNWGPGMIDADPLFVSLAEGDYHLTVDSPCIDWGDPYFEPLPDETDMDGDPRVMSDIVDMGADEYFQLVCISQRFKSLFQVLRDFQPLNLVNPQIRLFIFPILKALLKI